MEQSAFTDKTVKPDEDTVFSIIGNKRILWQKILNYLYDHHTDISEEWKYYSDGKRWLFRALQKKKTLFWIQVLQDTFLVAFWFPDRAETFIEQSDLPERIKYEFRNAKRYKMGRSNTRSVAITMSKDKDVDPVIQMIELKLKIK